jgi:phosphopantetheinyl transferase (holo-ACP synthase)
VDFEQYRTMSRAAARFFLTESEMQQIADASGTRTGHWPCLLRLWTIKEALFKADPGNNCRLVRDYEVMNPWAPSGKTFVSRTPEAAAGEAGGGSPAPCPFLYTSVTTAAGMLSLAVSLAPA